MVFSSSVFLFGFLPISLLLYYVSPVRLKNGILFILSLIFYSWGEPIYVTVMLASLTSAYLLAFPIAKYREKNHRLARAWLWLSVTVNLAFLVFFKYTNFFIENLRLIPPFASALTPVRNLALPVGISFYTFQIISYSVDLYRKNATLQRNYIAIGTYVALFPQLIAGPIVRYSDIDRQLTERCTSIEKFASGVRRFTSGFAKKLILGDSMGALHAYFSATHSVEPTMLGAWMIMLSFSLHIYFDFSGYSDMAIGLGRMFGFNFPENFNYPYISRSITDFWKRWHISLSSFFREYVYIPLGGNRKGHLRQYLNLAIVWLLTGLWHGASWNFVAWGIYYLILLIIEKSFLHKRFKQLPPRISSITGIAYTLLAVGIGWIIFSSPDLSNALSIINALVGIGTVSFSTATLTYTALRALPLAAIAAFASTPTLKSLWRRIITSPKSQTITFQYFEPMLTALLLVISISYMVSGGYSPFLYFNF